MPAMKAFARNAVLTICGLALAVAACRAQEYPSATISNGLLKAVLFTPDARDGYYRATRFDWAGIINSLQFQGHEYFGPRVTPPNPLIHNSIAGPVECFEEDLGFDDAKPGGRFVRIGVGVLEKPLAPDFQPGFDHTYRVLDPGRRRLAKGENWIEFVQEIPAEQGYGFVYTKRIQLTSAKSEMTIFHVLKNTGSKVIETTQYNHNYFMIDRQTSGPGFVLRFRFAPRLNLVRGSLELASVSGNEILVLKEPPVDSLALLEVEGYEPTADHYDITLENRNTEAGVQITTDRPMAKLRIVVDRAIVAPEPFIKLRVPPGKSEEWTTTYTFSATTE